MGEFSTLQLSSTMAKMLLIAACILVTVSGSVMDQVQNVGFYEKLMNNPKEAAQHLADNAQHGEDLDMDDDADLAQLGFLQVSSTQKNATKSKCAIKCRTDCAEGEESPAEKISEGLPAPSPAAMDLESIRKAALASKATSSKDAISMKCMNHCGGLCRQLCAKFKVLKVCNGCTRGCLKRYTQTTPAMLNAVSGAQNLISLESGAANIDLNA